MFNFKKVIFATVLNFILAFSFALYASDSIPAQEENNKVRIQFKWFHQFQFAGYYAALEKGFYAEEGLEVELLERNKDKGYVESVLDGDAEYGVADSGLLVYRLQDKPVVLVAQIFQHSPLVFIAKADSGIISPFEMINRKIMYDLDAYNDAPLQAMLIESLGSVDQMTHLQHSFNYDDLINKKVDVISAYLTDQPYLFKEKKVEVNIINPQSYGVDFYGDNLFTTQDEVNSNSERVEKIRRATLRGWEYAIAHKNEIIDIILKKYNTQNVSKERLEFEAEMTERMILSDWVPIGTVEERRFDKVAKIYRSLGYISDVDIPEDFIYLKGQSKIHLTLKERRWIRKHRNIVFAGSKDWQPLVIEAEDGQLMGIEKDYIDIVNAKTGLNIKLKTAAWNDAVKWAQSGLVDGLVSSAAVDERRQYFNFTDSYLKLNKYILVANSRNLSIESPEDLDGLKVGIIRGNQYDRNLIDKYTDNADILEYDSYLEAGGSLIDGKCDALIGSTGSIYSFVISGLVSGIRAAYFFRDEAVPIVYSIRKDWPILQSIINKAISHISSEEHQAILQKWMPMALPSHHSLDFNKRELDYIKENPTINLAVEEAYRPKSYRNPQGKLVGIDVDYMTLLAQFIGVKINFVGLSWPKALDMAFNHEVHGIVNADELEERKKYLNFTNVYSVAPQAIVVTSDSEISEWQDLEGRTIVTGQGTSHAKMLRSAYPKSKVLEVKTIEEELDAILNAKADAIFDDLVVLSDYIARKQYRNLKVAFMHYDKIVGQARVGLRNDHPELVSIFNKAINALNHIDHQTIMNKWLAIRGLVDEDLEDRSTVLINLTHEEKAWLANNHVIKVATDPVWRPVEFRDKNGQMQGISVEYFNKISKLLGVEFEFIKINDWAQAVNAVKKGEAHVLSALLVTEERKEFLDFTKPYLVFPIVIFTRENVPYVAGLEQLNGKKVAVIKGYASTDKIMDEYPLIDYIECSSAIDALKKLQSQEVYASLNNLAVGTQYVHQLGYYNIKVAGETGKYYRLAMGVNKKHSILRDILEKSLSTIGDAEKNEIYQRWIAVAYEYKFNYSVLLKVALVILAFVCLVIVWNIRLNKEIRKRASELKEAYSEVELSNERYEQLAALSSDIVWELDENYIFKYVSKRSIDVIGHDPSDLVGNCCLDFLDATESAKLKEHFEENIKLHSKRLAYEYSVPKKDASAYVVLEMFALPLYDNEGNFVGYRGISRDVTERKRSEEMLIQNEKMISVGSLAAGMAHEINNPLGSIMQGLQNIIRRLDKGFAKNSAVADEVGLDMEALDRYLEKRGIWNFLNGLRNSGYRASKIVNNMLQFSRKSSAEKSDLELGQLIDESIALAENDYNLQTKYDFKYVKINKKLEDEKLIVNCVGVEIEQVLLNLLKNSAQALYEQHIEGLEPVIWIRSRSYGKMLEIEVEDNGPGIADNIRRRIFEPFFTTKPVGLGTGVGLSVSYFIITEKHNGELLVDSVLGKGTKFTIRLPLT